MSARGELATRLMRVSAGAVFGAGMASMANAATSAGFGPPEVIVFGAAIPVWSAIFGLVGVVLARRVAPATVAGRALGPIGNAALTLLLALGVLALIVAGEKRPVVALGWSIGLGYSGLGAIELIARAAIAAGKTMLDAAAEVAGKAAAAWAARRGDTE